MYFHPSAVGLKSMAVIVRPGGQARDRYSSSVVDIDKPRLAADPAKRFAKGVGANQRLVLRHRGGEVKRGEALC